MQTLQNNYKTYADLSCYDLCADSTDLTAAELNAELTQAEKHFIVKFIANTANNLLEINIDCLADNTEYFIRTADLQEVLQNLTMLTDTMQEEPAVFTFTLADAATALCSYDTEYRDCILEQFMQACVDKAMQTSPAAYNLLTLYARICNVDRFAHLK